MSRTWVALATALGALVPGGAGAEPITTVSTRHIDAGGFLGGTFFTDSVDLGNASPAFGDQAPNGGFSLGLRGGTVLIENLAPSSSLAPQLSAEGELRLALSSMPGDAMGGRDSFSSPVLGWRAHGLVSIWPSRKLSPHAVLGLAAETIFTDSPFASDGDTDLMLYWGVGGKYALAPRYGVRADLRHGIAAARPDGLTSTFELGVGFYYRFSLTRRTKIGKKVVASAEPPPEPDLKPTEPPPPADRDKDGIPDDKDKCPDKAEIVNEIDDEDGCPEVDSDHDGLLGSRDKCPEAAEDVDGHEDDDGCPDPDNDGDGRPDVIDQCPMKPETLNGFEDEDGCPDTVPKPIARYTGVLPGIKFRSGNARILRKSRRTLNGVVRVLTKYPKLRIRVEGHTDNRGKHAFNLSLSRRRADAVKWYLVDKGVLRARIETVGFGPDKPIASNKTWRGRAKNRRIEIKLLPGPATIPDPRAEAGGSQSQPTAPAAAPPKPAPKVEKKAPEGSKALEKKAPEKKAPEKKAPKKKAAKKKAAKKKAAKKKAAKKKAAKKATTN